MMPKRGLRFDLSRARRFFIFDDFLAVYNRSNLEFVDGRTFFGLSSISVDSEHTNPTQMNHIITGALSLCR